MRVENTNNNIFFGSKNCPIKPFAIKTKQGDLFVEELQKKDRYKAAKFQFFCTVNSIPKFEQYRHISNVENLVNISDFMDKNREILHKKDGNSTILVAKDSDGEIKAFFSLGNFDRVYGESNKPKDIKTGFIHDCLLDEKYRNEGVGQVLLEKLLKTVQGYFSDVLLWANNKAFSFYKRSGFEAVDFSNPKINKIPTYVFGYGEGYATLMSKSLDSSNPWWEKAAKYY